jgi:putative ATP-dependent endonuclease of OLD family
MSILIKTVRVAGFRGLENLEVELEQTTVLTGMNNTGKTSFLKALQIALGNRQFVSQDDFFIKDDRCAEQ